MLSGPGEAGARNALQYSDGVRPEIETSGKSGLKEKTLTGNLRISDGGIRESINICWSISNVDSVSPVVPPCCDEGARNLTGDFAPLPSS